VLEKEYLEEYVPVLALIASRLVSNPEWSLKLLDTTTRKLLLPMYRQERDGAEDLSRAIEAGQEVVRRCPNELADMVALAHLLARAEWLEESLAWINQAIALEPDVAGNHRLRASVLERLGRFVEAEEAIARADALVPDLPELQEDRRRIAAGVVAWNRQERDGAEDLSRAIEAGQEVVRRCPNELADMVALAHLLARAEWLEESLAWIDRALGLKADDADLYRFRGSVLERLGRFWLASEAIKMGLRFCPDDNNLSMDWKRIRRSYIRASCAKLFRYFA